MKTLLSLFLLAAVIFAEPPKFPEPYDSEKSLPAKVMSAAEAAAGFKLPPGFRVEVFAAEPDVRNPIACCWDTKGRFWVAENYTYAERELKFDLNLSDRVLIFTPKADGKPERKVFIDTVKRLTSVEVGLGGVWLMCPPQLLFVPDRNGDDIPDGPPEVVLEGFDIPAESYHNLANGLKWGPDGWLYGRCGCSAPGSVRRPDQGPKDAIPLTGGIWRYHPKRKVFEPLCHGTTNPWGHDWNEQGDCFFINTVNGHLWQMIPGAHYHRSHTLSPNPLVYEPMQMIADHWHFDTGKGWKDSGKVDATVDKLGGGHAHSGCMIYNGAQWPEEYRHQLFTLNFHGRRANVEKLELSHSGYVGKHQPDMFQASDPNFRGMELSEGPDGSVYVLDWHDAGECHDNTGVMRSTGRVYRITYAPGNSPRMKAPHQLDDINLGAAHFGYPGWLMQQTRREILTRADAGHDMKTIIEVLRNHHLPKNELPWLQLHQLNTLHALGEMKAADWTRWLNHDDEHVKVTAIRLLLDGSPIDRADAKGPCRAEPIGEAPMNALTALAHSHKAGLVRLALASSLQRLPWKERLALAASLSDHEESDDERNVAPLIWYGLTPIAWQQPADVTAVAAKSELSLVRRWTARRFAELVAEQPALLENLLTQTASRDEFARRDIVRGMSEGLSGIRKAKPPASWAAYPKAFTDAKSNETVRALDVVFGDGRALDEVKKLALDDKADLEQRKAAVRSLIDANPPELRQLCETLIKVRFLNTVALKGLAKFDDAGPAIMKAWGSFHQSERSYVVDALCSRASFAGVLLAAMERGTVKRTDLSAAQARSIRGFDKPELTAKLNAVWGEFRESSKDKTDLMAKLKAELTKEVLTAADAGKGRATFTKTCATCHKLYGEGQSIGPDLTGAGRKDMDYLLSNIIDPSAVVTKDFQVTKFIMSDGRVLTGIVVSSAPKTVTIQLEKEKVTVAKEDIESQKGGVQSLMPDGLLQTLDVKAVRDLMKYLQSDSQVEAKP